MTALLELTRRAEASHFWFRGFRRFVRPELEAAAASRRALRIVDCGRGTGHNLALLRPYGQAFGFDLTASAIRTSAAPPAGFVTADITRIPFRSNSFDLVTSFDVLQCVPDDGAALAEMVRVARPGGR